MVLKFFMNFIVVSFVSFFFTQNSFSQTSCKLPKGHTLNIACTHECNFWMRLGLKGAAKRLGYKLKITNLYSGSRTHDLNSFDGFLIPGGADINPKYYKDKVDEDLKAKLDDLDSYVKYSREGDARDPFEYGFLEEYFSNEEMSDVPVLGICRGMQMITVSQGIPLYIDIKKELGIRNRYYTLDKVFVTNQGSDLYSKVKRRNFFGAQIHHQALRLDYFLDNKEEWPNFNITAVSNGGHIVEGIELSDRPVLGVQFHPEYMIGQGRRGVFNWLLEKACVKANL